MYGEFVTGGQFPRPEDHERLERYDHAWALYEGKHYDHPAAKRIVSKLAKNDTLRNLLLPEAEVIEHEDVDPAAGTDESDKAGERH